MENIGKERNGSLTDTGSDSAAPDTRTEENKKEPGSPETAGPGGAAPEMCAGTKMRVVYGDCTLGLHGEGFDYIFNYGDKSLESLVKNAGSGCTGGLRPPFGGR